MGYHQSNSHNYPDLSSDCWSAGETPDYSKPYCSHGSPGSDESFVLYGSSDSIVENNISEGQSEGFQIHGGTIPDYGPGGHNNQILGNISFEDLNGFQIDGRYAPLESANNNLIKDLIVIHPQGPVVTGGWLQQASNATIENLTMIDTEDVGINARYKTPCDTPDGCNFTIRNSLILTSEKDGIRVADYNNYLIEYTNSYGNDWNDYVPSENISDNSGFIQNSRSDPPTDIGLGTGQCVVFIPDTSNMKGAGKNGADIGATVLYRTVDGAPTSDPLWDVDTRAFTCGAAVPGLNDEAGNSCYDIHERLNVNFNGCTLPYSDDNQEYCNYNGICNANESDSCSDCDYAVTGQEYCDGIDNDGNGMIDEAQGFDKGFCDLTTLRPIPSDLSTSILTQEELKLAFKYYYDNDVYGSFFSKNQIFELASHVPAEDANGEGGSYTHYQRSVANGIIPLIRMYELTDNGEYLNDLITITNNLLGLTTEFEPGGPPGWDATGCHTTGINRWQLNEFWILRALTEFAFVMQQKELHDETVDETIDAIVAFTIPILDYYMGKDPYPNYIRISSSKKGLQFSTIALNIWKITKDDRYLDYAREIHEHPDLGVEFGIDDENFLFSGDPIIGGDSDYGSHSYAFIAFLHEVLGHEGSMYDTDDIRRTMNMMLFRVWQSDPNVILEDQRNPPNADDDTPYPNLYFYWVDASETDCHPGNSSAYSGFASKVRFGRYDGRAWWLLQELTRDLIDKTLIFIFPGHDGCNEEKTNQAYNNPNEKIAEALRQLMLANGEITNPIPDSESQ